MKKLYHKTPFSSCAVAGEEGRPGAGEMGFEGEGGHFG